MPEIRFIFTLSPDAEDRVRINAIKEKDGDGTGRHTKRSWAMKKETAVRRNLDLLDAFMKYAFDHPEILDGIPPDAELVILPKDDPELFEANKRHADSMVKAGKKVVVVEMKKPKMPKPQMAVIGEK